MSFQGCILNPGWTCPESGQPANQAGRKIAGMRECNSGHSRKSQPAKSDSEISDLYWRSRKLRLYRPQQQLTLYSLRFVVSAVSHLSNQTIDASLSFTMFHRSSLQVAGARNLATTHKRAAGRTNRCDSTAYVKPHRGVPTQEIRDKYRTNSLRNASNDPVFAPSQANCMMRNCFQL